MIPEAPRDYAAIIVACIAALVSIVTLVLTTRLTEGRERRKVLWERELVRFSELEDVAGCLVEDLLRFSMRTPEGTEQIYDKLRFLKASPGRFLRYDQVAAAVRDLENSAGWYISNDLKFDKVEDAKARAEISDGFRKLIAACDKALSKAPRGL